MRTHNAIGAVALLGILLSGCRKNDPPAAAQVSPTVSIAHPISRKINEWDEFSGRLASPETVEVRARVSGYIETVHFKEGSDVKQGDRLFTIDQRPYKAAVDRAKAELNAARARVELARGEAKRAEGLAAAKAISTDTFETRVKTAAEAEEAVRSADAVLKMAELDLEFTEIRAPIAGRISNARVTSGNLVIGGSTASTTPLTTIVSLDPIYCYFDADDASMLRYRKLHREGKNLGGMFDEVPVEMALGNEHGFPHKGVVNFVDNQLNPGTGTIRARGVFPNPDKLMTPGFYARVRIPGISEYDGVLVRDSAIGSDQGRAFVLTVDDNNVAAYRAVKLGPIIDGLRVVREGLKESERVIVSGLMSSRPGVHVQPQLVSMATNAPAVPNTTVSSAKP